MTSTKMMWFFICAVFIVPIFIWRQQTGDLSIYFDGTAPPGQLPYIFSKLMGMLALTIIAVQVIISLCQFLQIITVWWLGRTHLWFGVAVVIFSLSHLLLFFTAVTLRQESVAVSLFFPDFRDFYHTHLSFGLLGLWLLIVVAVIGRLRKKQRFFWLAKYHRIYWVAIVLIYFHALAVGSESQSPAGLLFYASLGSLMAILGLWSLARSFKVRQVAFS